jgi:hypothetical protein
MLSQNGYQECFHLHLRDCSLNGCIVFLFPKINFTREHFEATTYVYMCVCMCIYIYMCVYIYTYILSEHLKDVDKRW